MRRTRRVGAAVILGAVGALIWSVGYAGGQTPESPATRGGSRFVQIGDEYVNLDQITHAKVLHHGDRLVINVFFTGNRQPAWLGIVGKEAEQLKAILDGMTLGPAGKAAVAIETKPARDVPGPGSAPEIAPADEKFLVYDGFDGKLGLKWNPVRPDPTHVSLTKNPGKLTITTQRGSIHGDEKNDALGEGIQAKNLYLIDNPLAADTDFVVTTCVSGFTPETSYQQAGLIVYNDDDNYLKFGYEYNWPKEGGQAFCILTETDAKSDFKYIESSEAGLKRYWVRLTKRGDHYEYATSTDGKEFRTHGEVTWGDGSPKRIGILAKNGGNKEAGELDAAFEFFELATARPAEGVSGPEPSEEGARIFPLPGG